MASAMTEGIRTASLMGIGSAQQPLRQACGLTPPLTQGRLWRGAVPRVRWESPASGRLIAAPTGCGAFNGGRRRIETRHGRPVGPPLPGL